MLGQMFDGLVRIQVEESLAGGVPTAPMKKENGRGTAHILNRLQSLHVAPWDCIKGNEHGNECGQFPGPLFPCKHQFLPPLAVSPAQASWFTG